MPRISKPTTRAGAGGVVPGIYAALLEREGRCYHRVDPRWRFTAAGRRGEPPPSSAVKPRSAVIEALEGRQPVKVQGRNLPREARDRFGRSRAFDWFEVTKDDRVTACAPPRE